MTSAIRYLSADEAAQVDADLMSDKGAFTLEQLMELAGLACAQTLAKVYTQKKILVITGPGNQGGDGLVAARHLKMFGYEPIIYQVAEPKKEHYVRLTKQCENLCIPIVKTVEGFEDAYGRSQVVMDCIFGFSFHPPVRPPYNRVLSYIATNSLPIVSIDIPSGWDVNSGRQALEDTDGMTVQTFEPDVLLSLTAPKRGTAEYKGRHLLGGRFGIPPHLQLKYDLKLEYSGIEQVIELK